jgi:hypothetical protein
VQGEWKEDKKNGKGVFMWANGDRYEGEWMDDKPNGRGVKTWAKGDRCVPFSLSLPLKRTTLHHSPTHVCHACRYEGEWKDGKQSGRGILVHPDGRSEDGSWENDLPHGGTYLLYERVPSSPLC